MVRAVGGGLVVGGGGVDRWFVTGRSVKGHKPRWGGVGTQSVQEDRFCFKNPLVECFVTHLFILQKFPIINLLLSFYMPSKPFNNS